MKALLIFVAMVSGCALSPADLRDKGDRVEMRMKQSPDMAASCVARGAENLGSALFQRIKTSAREGVIKGQKEIVMFVDESYVAAVDLSPNGNGSKAVVWLNPNMFEFFRERLLGAMASC